MGIYIKVDGDTVELAGKVADEHMLKDGYILYEKNIPDSNFLKWDKNTESIIIDVDRRDEYIKKIQYDKIAEISSSCRDAIIGGFYSNAIDQETPYKYKSDETDQLNLLALVTANSNDYIKCSKDNGKTYSYILHTVEQFKKVLDDGKAKKYEILFKYENIKKDILSLDADTIDKIKEIKW